MRSRSWQYWRFEYDQKLLTQKWSCGLRQLQNVNLGNFGMGVMLFSYTMLGPCMRIQISCDFLFWCIRKPWFRGQEMPGTPESVVWPCTRIKSSRKFEFSYTVWDPCSRITISRNLFIFVRKANQAIWVFLVGLQPFSQATSQSASQPAKPAG